MVCREVCQQQISFLRDFMRPILGVFGLLALFAIMIPLFAGSAFAESEFASPAIEHRIDALLRRMTLDEKVGQLVLYSAGVPTGPGTGRADYREQVAKGQLGSIGNLTGAAETNALQRIAIEHSRLGIPLLFGIDVIHGYRTVFPVPLGMASTWDPQLVEQAARVAAKEATAEGIRWTFSPMVDIARDARWGRIVEGAGEDPYLGSAMAAAYVRGYQGANLASGDSLAASAKHYAGYGAAEAGRDYNPADMSERTLRQTYLPPFESAVKAGAATIMSAFNTLNGVPATANPMTLTKILRGEWNFQGLVVSDWQAIAELIPHGIALDGATAARKAILAGLDVDMESGLYQRHLSELVRTGAVPEAVLDEAVRRVLRVKFALGLFDRPYAPEAAAGLHAQLDPAHLELARTLAERSLVLLKNDLLKNDLLKNDLLKNDLLKNDLLKNDLLKKEQVSGSRLLPLSSSVKTIALIGPFADDAVNMLGSWPGKGDAKNAITLKAALGQRMFQSGGRLLYAQGTGINSTADSGFDEAVQAASQAELVIAALGEDAPSMTAEAASRAHLDLPGNQQQLLERIVATGKPVVLIIFSGRPLALTWAAAHVPAMVQAWYPGVEAGPALVRTLFGEVNFSGKLTLSMPRSVGQEPLYYNALSTGRPADGVDLTRPPATPAEKYVSRYIDEQNAPLFPFGFGLSYTQFSYSPLELSETTASARALNSCANSVRVSTTVTNKGLRMGREIVQLYIGQRGTSVARPIKELKGFRILVLAPGESESVEFQLGRDQLAFWNIDMHSIVEPAEVSVWIGPNSAEGQMARFTIAE
jgi:beta-glucosidase